MSAPSRKKKSSRWALLLGSGVAAASFYVAIVNGPQPVQAAPQPAAAVAEAPARLEPSSGNSGAAVNPALPQPSAPQSPVVRTRPRLRSRAS